MLAVDSREWVSTASLVVFPRLVKYPHQPEHHISFQDASLASPACMNVRVWFHETGFREQRRTRYNFFFSAYKTGTAMAVPAVVAATAQLSKNMR